MNAIAVSFFVFASSILAEQPAEKTADSQEKIHALIEKMGDERFVVGDGAYDQLSKMIERDDGFRLLPSLKIAAQHQDLEISCRARTLIKRYYYVVPTDYPYIPWIDMLPEDIPNRKEIAGK